jgi:hypothetical protein
MEHLRNIVLSESEKLYNKKRSKRSLEIILRGHNLSIGWFNQIPSNRSSTWQA